jgi:hypothetical protein
MTSVRDGGAVDEDLKAGGTAGAVVADGDVHPRLRGADRIEGADGDGIAGPEVDERPFEAAVLEEQFVAAAGGVGPRAGTVENDSALLGVSGVCSQREIVKGSWRVEVAEGGVDGMVAGELEGLVGGGAGRDRGRRRFSLGVVAKCLALEGAGEAVGLGRRGRAKAGRRFRRR